jgi:hypothetical protein
MKPQHLFIDRPFAKIIWRIIRMSFSLALHKNITKHGQFPSRKIHTITWFLGATV